MKKLIIILFSFFYLGLTSGITLNLHYCGGKIKSISFFHSNDEDGCCGKKMKSKGCCDEKTTIFKVKDNHQSSDNIKLAFNQYKVFDAVIPVLVSKIILETNSHSILNYHAPPVLYDNPLYLKHRVLLI